MPDDKDILELAQEKFDSHEKIEDAEELELEREYDYAMLDSFGEALAKHRSECIAARQSSHIEEIWIEDEEFYEGIDEANRSSEKRTDWHQKPPGQTSGLDKKATRSTVFPNITAPFVDAATARLCDVILPVTNHEPSWSFEPSPVPELISAANGEFPDLPEIDYNDERAVMQQAKLENNQMNDAQRQIDEAKARAKKASKRIHDWHVECNRKSHVRKVIEDAGRMGVGVLKGPFNKVKRRMGYIDGKPKTIVKVTPHSKRIDPWNLYPAKDCGEDIQSGDGIWERDFITKKQLREFLDDENYIPDQIMRCLIEGPQKANAIYKETPEPVTDPHLQEKYEIWYYHGSAEREELEAGGCDCTGIEDPYMPAMVTMVNNHVIRAALNPLDTGQYPYSTFCWRRRSGYWAGIGISRQIRTAQKIVTGGARNLMDNAGLGAGPMIVFRQGSVYPADNVAGIGPRKVFYIAEDEDSMVDATKAIGVIKVDMVVDDLLKIIQWGMKLAEDTTGLPMLLQGQMGAAPDTVGGMRLLQNNTAPPLRALARAFDNEISETELERYYVYLLLYGEADDEKGDYFINAQGSSTLVERDLQDQELGSMASIVLNPAYKGSPSKWFEEFLKSRRFDPENFVMDEEDEEYQAMVQAAQQPPADPRLEIAGMKAQVDGAKIQTDAQLKMEQIASSERMTAFKENLTAELKVYEIENANAIFEAEQQIKLMLADIDYDVDSTRTAADREAHNEKIKADIAREVMKIQSVERLAGVKARADQMPTPPIEPPGRAPTGQSYSR